MRGTVLVVDDHSRPRRALATELEDAGFAVVEAGDGQEAWEHFRGQPPDVVITDMVMPRSDGLELLTRIRAQSDVPVILFTARGSIESAAAAFKAGADDFVASPDVGVDDLVALVAHAVEGGREGQDASEMTARLPGQSAQMCRVRERVAGLAPLWTPVLISGEPGTGRGTVARALHDYGVTAGAGFVAVACTHDTSSLLLPAAGVLYLANIDSLPPRVQSQLVDHLVETETTGFGPGLRIFASTSENLSSLSGKERFDSSLALLLLRFHIQLPPLRARASDIPELANALVQKLAGSLGRNRARLTPAATSFLAGCHWPGNITQIEQVLERAVVFCPDAQIKRGLIADLVQETEDSLASIRERHARMERDDLLETIHRTGGNISQTAEILGKSRSAIYRLIDKHRIPLRRE
ncbi:MAG: sigma-54-dependent Fis family transcriptional regulator [Deltaproteobacteria bacterium]|nr:sigma-54-dependent Fis family transcriptional regulator [Deltaproteobacteria bacterium]MBW2422343.1 sigma-54-dependent Fis family transcriptional regulator [Deltaproteobacteria bacterium]